MGITSFIKTRLLNNRVEQYNTKRSYWGEDERQPRNDGINIEMVLLMHHQQLCQHQYEVGKWNQKWYNLIAFADWGN